MALERCQRLQPPSGLPRAIVHRNAPICSMTRRLCCIGSTYNGLEVVTRAGTGFGEHTALALLKDRYSVPLAGRWTELLETNAVQAGPAATGPMCYPPTGAASLDPRIDPDHAVRGVVYIATLPLHANVQFSRNIPDGTHHLDARTILG